MTSGHVLGIGTDIVEIDRIRAILKRYPSKFLKRILTPYEQKYCLERKEPALHLAGRFAAKEAIVKAIGTGFSHGLSWTDIEICNDTYGKPSPFLSPFLLEKLGNDVQIQISISHCKQYATAFAICIKTDFYKPNL